MKKWLEGLNLTQIIVTLLISLASSVASAFASYNYAQSKIETRISALEQYVSRNGPPHTYWEEKCGHLIDRYADATSMSAPQVERAMKAAGCDKEPPINENGT